MLGSVGNGSYHILFWLQIFCVFCEPTIAAFLVINQYMFFEFKYEFKSLLYFSYTSVFPHLTLDKVKIFGNFLGPVFPALCLSHLAILILISLSHALPQSSSTLSTLYLPFSLPPFPALPFSPFFLSTKLTAVSHMHFFHHFYCHFEHASFLSCMIYPFCFHIYLMFFSFNFLLNYYDYSLRKNFILPNMEAISVCITPIPNTFYIKHAFVMLTCDWSITSSLEPCCLFWVMAPPPSPWPGSIYKSYWHSIAKNSVNKSFCHRNQKRIISRPRSCHLCI